ncbi:MAG: peptidoglycan-binding protein [Candidatus Devosia symbiotica]|nr:peptidoglycan-binding protein [Candidatus Devosia symbiotica]
MFDMFERNRVLRNADKDGNTSAAEALIATNEPILSFDTVYNLQLAISQYESLVAIGDWKEIPQEAYGLTLSNSKSSIIALKRHRISSGDMDMLENVNDVFDAQTDAGVRKFQARHGLNIKGPVDAAIWYAMAVPAEQRLGHCCILAPLNLANMPAWGRVRSCSNFHRSAGRRGSLLLMLTPAPK